MQTSDTKGELPSPAKDPLLDTACTIRFSDGIVLTADRRLGRHARVVPGVRRDRDPGLGGVTE